VHEPLQFDHVALPCFDVAASRRFYEDALGLRLLAAFTGDSELWRGRFLHLAFGSEGGGAALDLFAVEGLGRPEEALPPGIRHVALALASAEELATRRARLAAQGVWVSGPVAHGNHDSLYCFDPNGHQIELTFRRAAPGDGETKAAQVVERWCAEHDLPPSGGR
jgi:catechol 2,3-dioxygenase-like lactoylglutathione lyase family enzyme